MKKENQKNLCITLGLLAAFVLWTIAVSFFDVQTIGPRGSAVGFATLNGLFHHITGVHMLLYTITDWLSLVPLGFAMGFAVLGQVQLIKRRSLLKVDFSILVLGGYYVLVMSAYTLFEVFVINYRPILIEGYLEASYPSSTTLLVLCMMPTAISQLNGRIQDIRVRKSVSCLMILFSVFMVMGRLFSGVHWFTDIFGGILLSAGLVMLYHTIIIWKAKRH
ncbi:MAG: phosphatase PAP2 family protein [Lachnospiraceae bacterium]|nr:phosphatase PAP2 family protein [Lachnospiraceae bacterium]